MASEVDICNLALAYLGDTASLSSIDPPEGSAQADHCHRFYPIARDTLLEMHLWNFSMRRIAIALAAYNSSTWSFAYLVPSDAINLIAVIPPDVADDYSVKFVPTDAPVYAHNYSPMIQTGRYIPQPYAVETQADGSQVLYTNQENAVLRYTAHVLDTNLFSPLFTMTLAWHLASMLAGPVIKGEAGAAEAKRCLQMMMTYLKEAQESDSLQRNIKPEHVVPWTSGR
jgi:hypothetical protein